MRRLLKTFAALLGALAIPAAASAAGEIQIPGTDSTIKFNGFAEMNLTYEFSGGPGGNENYSNPAGIPLDPYDSRVQTLGLAVAYSRFGLQTNTPSAVGNIGVRLEGDFAIDTTIKAGASFTDSRPFRVRHAYGTVGDLLLLGQTWSTFADLGAFADQQDENPTINLAPLRAPMIRGTFQTGFAKVSVAAENPRAITGAPAAAGASVYYTLPDLIGRIDVPFSLGSVSARAVLRQFQNTARSAYGIGGAVGASLKIGGDTLVLDGSIGAGLGPYQYGVYGDAFDNGTDIKLVTSYGGHVGYTHVWNAQWRSNLIGAGVFASDKTELRNAVGATYDAKNKTVLSGVFNTYYSLARNAWVGVEFWYNYREVFGGASGKEFRGELTTHFDLF